MAQFKPVKGRVRPQHNFSRKICRGAFWSCWHCGLILLHNEATEKARAKGCVEDQEPINEYKD